MPVPSGLRAREIVDRTGVHAGAVVPVLQGGSVHSVITLGSRTPRISEDLFESLIFIGRLVELALTGLSTSVRQV
jgi:hypothetical protein